MSQMTGLTFLRKTSRRAMIMLKKTWTTRLTMQT